MSTGAIAQRPIPLTPQIPLNATKNQPNQEKTVTEAVTNKIGSVVDGNLEINTDKLIALIRSKACACGSGMDYCPSYLLIFSDALTKPESILTADFKLANPSGGKVTIDKDKISEFTSILKDFIADATSMLKEGKLDQTKAAIILEFIRDFKDLLVDAMKGRPEPLTPHAIDPNKEFIDVIGRFEPLVHTTPKTPPAASEPVRTIPLPISTESESIPERLTFLPKQQPGPSLIEEGVPPSTTKAAVREPEPTPIPVKKAEPLPEPTHLKSQAASPETVSEQAKPQALQQQASALAEPSRLENLLLKEGGGSDLISRLTAKEILQTFKTALTQSESLVAVRSSSEQSVTPKPVSFFESVSQALMYIQEKTPELASVAKKTLETVFIIQPDSVPVLSEKITELVLTSPEKLPVFLETISRDIQTNPKQFLEKLGINVELGSTDSLTGLSSKPTQRPSQATDLHVSDNRLLTDRSPVSTPLFFKRC